MFNYDVEITRLFKDREDGSKMTEIWAKIIECKSGKEMNKKIWWEDEEGIFHDGTIDLPSELRKPVDNAWIEKRRKW